jgi:hypothetical protein
MRLLVLAVLALLYCGCDVYVDEKTPDVKVVNPPDVEVTTPKVDVEIERQN